MIIQTLLVLRTYVRTGNKRFINFQVEILTHGRNNVVRENCTVKLPVLYWYRNAKLMLISVQSEMEGVTKKGLIHFYTSYETLKYIQIT